MTISKQGTKIMTSKSKRTSDKIDNPDRNATAMSESQAPASAAHERRRRLPPHERENMILEGATRFFAKNGFDANIRDLAKECGVSQALIFKYFDTKETLVEKVYDRTFLQRWRPDWEGVLLQSDVTISIKLKEFYRSYLATVDDYIWIRIALFSGLSGNNMTSKYIQSNVSGLMEIIARELRIPDDHNVQQPVSQLEMEAVWLLHSTFIYYLIRKHIFRTPVERDQSAFVDQTVDRFLMGTLTPD